MMDYLIALYHTPLVIGNGLIAIWGHLYHLPWPPAREFFGSMVIFVSLYPLRIIMQAILPERVVARRVRKYTVHKKTKAPDQDEHQAGAASIGSLFH
jgi:hypothetical protein